jgi:hypothetical protein
MIKCCSEAFPPGGKFFYFAAIMRRCQKTDEADLVNFYSNHDYMTSVNNCNARVADDVPRY